MYRSPTLFALLPLLFIAGCANRVPEPVGLQPGTPHVSWIIMTGDRNDPDQQFICQSDPRTECIVPVSRPGAQVLANVHFYYHGAGKGTTYAGSLRVGFFPGPAASQIFQANATATKAEAIVNQSVTGVVTETPGTYALSLSLTATATDTGDRRSVAAEIPVVVR